MTAVFLVPLVALVTLRFVEGELGARGLALRLGPLLGLEFLFSTEVTFTLGLATSLALLLTFALLPGRRRRLAALLPPLLAACAFGAALTAPFVYYAVTGFKSAAFHPPSAYVTDLLNFAVPTKLALVGLGWAMSISRHFPGNDSERDGYLGVPVLIIVALFAWTRARTSSGRFLLGALALAELASLGARLTIDGHASVWLPWASVGKWPLFDNVLPERLAIYVSLLSALMVALWAAARPPGVLRWLLPGLAVLALVPNPAAGVWASSFSVPAFFTESAYRGCLNPDENILPLPVGAQSESMLWQAVDDYRFRMAGGNIAPTPPASFLSPDDVALIAEGYSVPTFQSQAFVTYIEAKDVTSVVLDASDADLWAGALDRIATPEQFGGVVIYHISDGAPSCLGAN